MNKALEHIDAAYAWLAKIPVTGDAVDYLAMARQELREARQVAADDKEGADG